MKTLKSIIEASNNPIVKEQYNKLWLNEWANFPSPYCLNVPVEAGDSMWIASSYCGAGLTNNINGCPTIRKALYRIISMNQKNIENFGYAYKNSDGSVSIGYCDDTIQNVTSYVSTGKAPKGTRMIHIRMKGNAVLEGCVEEDGNFEQLIFGNKKGHSLASYFYGFTYYLLSQDNFKTQAVIESIIDSLKLSYDDMAAREMAVLENDLILHSVNMESGYDIKNVIPFNEDIYKNAIENGSEKIIDCMQKQSKKVAPKARPKTTKELADSHKYDLGHKFAPGEEELIPLIYDSNEVDEDTEDLCAVIKADHDAGESSDVLMTGEAGTGKTTRAQMAARILRVPYYFITCTANTEAYDFEVNLFPNEVGGVFKVKSEFLKAFQYGGVIEVQELNAVRNPAVLMKMNAAMDDLKTIKTQDGEIIHRHPDCIIICTMNNGYEGTKPINQALNSRFNYKQNIELPTEKELTRRLEKNNPDLEKTTISNLVKCFFDIRKVLIESGETLGVCSYRELSAWAKRTAIFHDGYKAAQRTIIPSATFDLDLQAELSNVVGKYFSIV